MKKKIIFGILFCFCIGGAFGYVMGGTNFGFSGYPAFSARTPTKPYTSYYDSTVSEYDYKSYKQEVERYIDAVDTYVNNGNNDMKRIDEAQDEAIRQANKVINEYNSWIRTVTIRKGF